MSQNKNLKRNATFTIAEVALDIFLSGARKRRVTAKRFLLKMARLMTMSFRASANHIHNLSFFFPFFESILTNYCCYRFSFSKHAY